METNITEAIVDNTDIRKTMTILIQDTKMQQAMEYIDDVDK